MGERSEEMLEAQTFEGATRLISRGELNEVMAARLDQMETALAASRPAFEAAVDLLPVATQLLNKIAIHGNNKQARCSQKRRIGTDQLASKR